MMTETDFSAWSLGTDLTPEGIEFVRRIVLFNFARRRPELVALHGRWPVALKLDRSLHSTGGPYRAFYSFLLQCGLQLHEYGFESRPLQVAYVGVRSRVNFFYTAKMVILRQSSVEIVEVSSEERLVATVRRLPGLLVQQEGIWRCPPMAQALSRYGIGFIIWTPESATGLQLELPGRQP